MRGAERFSCVLALLLAVALYPAAGQSPDSALSILTTPIGPPLRCQRHDSASMTQLKLELGEPPAATRNIEAAYDSLGRARTLIDWAAGSNGARLDAVVVRFDTSGAVVFGFHRLDSLPSLVHKEAGAGLPPLTAAERARASTLSSWLWNHRCRAR